jgi:hypothetical protein
MCVGTVNLIFCFEIGVHQRLHKLLRSISKRTTMNNKPFEKPMHRLKKVCIYKKHIRRRQIREAKGSMFLNTRADAVREGG